MKRLFTLLFILTSLAGKAQTVGVDIDEQSQNRALSIREKQLPPELAQSDFTNSDFIEMEYQIPAYSLYNELWDHNHLRSTQIAIPFSKDTLKIILLGSHNTPFIFPCRGNIALTYGKQKRNLFHPGIDFQLQEDNPVYVCFDGVVRMTREYGDYGKIAVVRHYNGLETVYARLGKLQVKENQIVKAGHILGTAGKTGNSPEIILHFETRFLNEYFDPALMINTATRTLQSNILTLTPVDFIITPIPSQLIKPQDGSQKVTEPTTDTDSIPKIISPAPTQSQQSQPKETKYHTIQKGETLFRIANMYGISVEKLMELNNIKNGSQIRAGQKLLIRYSE